MENTRPDFHDDKYQVALESAKSSSPSGTWARHGIFKDEIDRASLELHRSDQSVHDDSRGWQMPVFQNKIERASLEQLRNDRSVLDDSHCEDPKPVHPQAAHGAIESELEHYDDGKNRKDSQDPMAHHAGSPPTPCPPTAPFRLLTERAVSKIPSARYDMEAWSRQCHAGLQEDIPNTGMLEGTHPTGPHSDAKSLKSESQSIIDARVHKQEMMDTWRGQVVPQKGFPHKALLDGKRLPEPHFETRKRRLQRRAASCTILSAAVPSERDATDLLTTPLGL